MSNNFFITHKKYYSFKPSFFLNIFFIHLINFLFHHQALANNLSAAQKFVYPAALIQLDDNFTHHIIVAEKATHRVHLFKNQSGLPEYVKSYTAATGKRRGNKLEKGDLKTPEGIYLVTEFLSARQLSEKYKDEAKIYGAGAFVLNYPNPMDESAGKTGGGIWLHSTDDNSRINKGLDSRGCVVIVDEDLKDISQYIELNKTKFIIVENLTFLTKETWNRTKELLNQTIESWRVSWVQENLDQYILTYSPEHFRDNSVGNYYAFRDYKKRVFSAPGAPQIQLRNLSILISDEYAVVHFIQDYVSTTINDSGRKYLFLKKDNNYEWKIVSEKWQKYLPSDSAKEGEQVAFIPSMRFFDQ